MTASLAVAVLTFPVFCAELSLLAVLVSMGVSILLSHAGIHLGTAGSNIVRLVLCGAVLVFAAFLSRHVYVAMRWQHAEIGGRYCVQCRYDLTGNVSGRCPECGLDLTDGEEAADGCGMPKL